MPSHPLVNIVVRTKDRPVLLRRALADIAAQTYPTWTVTLVNDGGDPALVERQVQTADETVRSRIRVLSNERSEGMEYASNQGIRAVAADLVAVHDDDDTWHPAFLERAVRDLEEHPEQVGVAVRTEIVYERPNAAGDAFVEYARETYEPGIHEITFFDLLRVNRAVPISCVFRRAIYDEVGFYDESLPACGDWEFNLRVARRYEIGFLDGDPLAFWHQRPEATGALGNSVFAARDAHRKYDLLVRERALHEHERKYGVGDLLYLTKILDHRMGELHDRLTKVDNQLAAIDAHLNSVEASLQELHPMTDL